MIRYNVFFASLIIIMLVASECRNKVVSSKDFLRTYYDDGKIKEEGYLDKEGKRTGLWKIWSEKGYLQSEKNYLSDKAEGASKSYYENGNVYVECSYKNDKLFGIYTMYFKNGQVNFRDSLGVKGQTGLFQVWYENGSLSQKGYHKNGKMIGEWRKYFKNTKLQDVQNYSDDGLKIGRWIYFNETGDTVKWEVYKNGIIVNSPQSLPFRGLCGKRKRDIRAGNSRKYKKQVKK